MSDGRRFASALEVRGERDDAGRLTLFAPQPGLWRHAPPEGALIRPGAVVGELEVLGVLHVLRAPQDAFGVVGSLPGGRRLGRRPVDARTALMTLDPEGVSGTEAAKVAAQAADGATGPVFRTPLGGRFYARPSPDADPFVQPGDALKGGETVALIEVMKTFNRVQYAGEPATVKAVAPRDGDDVEAGDVLLELE